jgi:hypothetical protein
VFLVGRYVHYYTVYFDRYGAAPACKIDLSSLIFSSAARSAATTAANGVSGGENLASYKGIHNLRLQGTNITGQIKRNETFTEVKAEATPVSGKHYLMVQGVTGDNTNYAYAKEVTDDTATIQTSDVSVTTVSSFEGAKAWLEKEGTDGDGQLLYANGLTTINSSTPMPLIDPTINSTSTSVDYKPNLLLKDVPYPTTDRNTEGAWSWNEPDSEVRGVGTHNFEATYTPTDTATYKPVTTSITVTVNEAKVDDNAASPAAPEDQTPESIDQTNPEKPNLESTGSVIDPSEAYRLWLKTGDPLNLKMLETASLAIFSDFSLLVSKKKRSNNK